MDTQDRASLLAFGASFTAATIWVLLAWRTPTSTFHFAPLVAAVLGTYVAKTSAGVRSVPNPRRVIASSALPVAGAVAILAAADRLRGPTFWSETGALYEAALFAVLGLLTGFAILTRGRRPRTEHESPHQEAQRTT